MCNPYLFRLLAKFGYSFVTVVGRTDLTLNQECVNTITGSNPVGGTSSKNIVVKDKLFELGRYL